MDNVDIVNTILKGLLKFYISFKVYLNTLHADKDALIHSLLSKEQLQKGGKDIKGTATALVVITKLGQKSEKTFGEPLLNKQSGRHKAKPIDECYYCHKKGHYKLQCQK